MSILFCDFFSTKKGAYKTEVKERIKELCAKNKISMNKLEDILGFGKGYISKLGNSNPNMSKIKKIADYFNVTIDYVMTGEKPESGESYYIDDEARELAQFLCNNPEYKVLFDASRNVKKEDIEFVKQMIDRIRGNNDGTGN